MNVRPPTPRAANESAGYLGFYTRSHLPNPFTLVDIDGTWPALWIYRRNNIVRVIEEKPSDGLQSLHGPQEKTLRFMARHFQGVQPYVIWEADRLVEPRFPVELTKLAPTADDDQHRSFTRTEFDDWVCSACGFDDWVGEAHATTWDRLIEIVSLPFALEGLPDDVDGKAIDRALTALAQAMRSAS